jgi:hypothetical protein
LEYFSRHTKIPAAAGIKTNHARDQSQPQTTQSRFAAKAAPTLLSGNGFDVDELSVLRAFCYEPDLAVALGEQRMVAADPDVVTGVKPCATLANEYVSRHDLLATENLDAQSLGV